MRYSGAVLAAVAFAVPLAARAQPIEGLYIGAGVGLDLPQDTRVTPLYPNTSSHQRLVQNVGIAALGSVGYALGNG
ncbi:MAG: hypothetical protein JOZ17_02100, partial [Acetobacteraceae bacterium]|nr:hypothetical protein [Acetobacteraceae bacterium]